MKIKVNNTNTPTWRSVTVKSALPAKLKMLEELSKNLWWVWNSEGKTLFHDLDRDLWRETGENPVLMLQKMTYERFDEIVNDKEMMDRINCVYNNFKDYMKVPMRTDIPSVSYFSMEYGLCSALKIYSGGLGILAGDYIKEASDRCVNMTAVGFLYRYGYFTQSLSLDGQQIANYEAQNFNQLPIEPVLDETGKQMILEVPYPGRTIFANIWRVNVGRMKLYLLDTDIDLNSEWDRPITHQLYGGDWENRIKQEYLLGIGGVLMLKKLGIKNEIYHCNEGHAALLNLQRLVDYVQDDKLSFNEALEVVRASSLYTVHTPVPAGHDYFDEGLFGKYMGEFPAKLGISWADLMNMGRENPDSQERFSMSVFALNTCQEANGVSWLHGEVSKKMFQGVWKGYAPEESHVGYVTNGVHFPTWCAKEWQAVYAKYLGKDYIKDQSNEAVWENIYSVPDEVIWNTRVQLKNKLIDYIRARFRENWLRNQGDPSLVVSLLDKINPNALLIGFARRFATYKRAHLLFTDLDRLAKIVNNPDYPVQFLFAGKAHPADGAGQGLIKKIYDISQRPEFMGKILFLDNYDMQLARRLVSGVDIWMNTPTRPLEASGTSGEKALMNGVVNLSVLDGWWYEGYREGAGWALTDRRTYQNQEHQDKLDASTIYSMLEQEIIPLYYARNRKGYSENWVRTVKNSIARIAPNYTMKRQLDDYYDRFYNPEAARFKHLSADDNKVAKSIAAWKESVAERWDSIRVVSSERSDNLQSASLVSGKEFTVRHIIDEQGLDDAIGIDLVVMSGTDGNESVCEVMPMEVVKREGNLYTFELTASIDLAGSYKVAYRMYPKHAELPSRQDFCYVRWFS